MNFDILREYLDTQSGTPYSETYVMRDHEVVFHHIAGQDNPNLGTRCKKNGFYHIFSCTKVMTATAGMRLFERGKFLMTTPVSEFLPEFSELTVRAPGGGTRPAEAVMTMGHLFTMTSGLMYPFSWPALEELKAKLGGRAPTVAAMRTLASHPLLFEPGTRFEYGLSHDVLGAVIEVISGKSLGDYLRDEILLPLGMTETGFSVPKGEEHRCVTPMHYDAETGTYSERPFTCAYRLAPDYESGGAGLITTPRDYALFADALASGGVGKTGARILSPATIDMMRTPMAELSSIPYFEEAGYRYGYGVRTMAYPERGNSPIGEFGWNGACGCFILADPKNKLSMFQARFIENPDNAYHSPRLRNVLYGCL